jgi:hypothetical protein
MRFAGHIGVHVTEAKLTAEFLLAPIHMAMLPEDTFGCLRLPNKVKRRRL